MSWNPSLVGMPRSLTSTWGSNCFKASRQLLPSLGDFGLCAETHEHSLRQAAGVCIVIDDQNADAVKLRAAMFSFAELRSGRGGSRNARLGTRANRRQGQQHAKRSPLAGPLAFGMDGAAVQLDDLLGDG